MVTAVPATPRAPLALICSTEIADDPKFATYTQVPAGCTAIQTGVTPVEVVAGDVAVNTPVTAAILKEETWFDCWSTT